MADRIRPPGIPSPPRETKFTKGTKTMSNARPSARQLADFRAAIEKAAQGPKVTNAWLKEIADRRDAYLASLR